MTGIVLITGATAGIGAAAARHFAGAGWKVVATGRRRERLDELVEELGDERVYPLAFDIQDEQAIAAAVEALPEGFRGIDVLINNAGLALGTVPFQEGEMANWRQMIDTNIVGLLAITRQLLPGLVERKGAIINLSSVAANYPYPLANVYAGTKAFVRQWSLCLRADLHGTGVRVTSVEPGIAETEFTLVRTGGDQAASDAVYGGMNPMTAEDIAGTLFWVATQPPRVNINSIELMPVSQSFAISRVAREE